MSIIIGKYSLYPHQVRAVEWMRSQEEAHGGGFLCDTMGMGKTWSMMGLISTDDSIKSTLVLCPLALVDQWTTAATNCRFHTYNFTTKKSWHRKDTVPIRRPAVYITNYNKKIPLESFDRIIIDEAHTLRNQESKLYLYIRSICDKATYKWALTGTPLVNHYRDLEALHNLVLPKRSVPNFDTAISIMETHALRRTIEDTGGVLDIGPAPEIADHIVDFTGDEEATFYRMIQGRIQRELNEYETFDSSNSGEIFRLIMRLRQISVHPQVYINAMRRQLRGSYRRADWAGSSAKIEALKNLLESQKESHNWVIYYHFNDEADLIIKTLNAMGPTIGSINTYSGSVTIEERNRRLETHKSVCERVIPRSTYYDFLEDHTPFCQYLSRHIMEFTAPPQNVLLVQLQCGGTGLNLQENDRIIFMGPWWTSALMNQAIARVYRIGQRKSVKVYRLLMKEELTYNIDRRMMERALEKEEACATLLGAAQK